MGRVTRTQYGCTKVLKFTNTEIQNLPLGIPLIQAAIPGKSILPLFCTLELSPWAADYTNIDVNATMQPDYPSGMIAGFGVFAPCSALLAGGGAELLAIDLQNEFYGNTPEPVPNIKGLALGLVTDNLALGAFTGGDPSQILTVTTCFIVI